MTFLIAFCGAVCYNCFGVTYMRMHKKNHLELRLERCNDILTVFGGEEKDMRLAAESKQYLDFAVLFGNALPVYLEIGCGKGKFIVETAKANPDKNFVACEKISNVIIDACEGALSAGLKNVHFLNCAAEVLEKYFPANSVSGIYLNFSNPLPKEGYKKQRLTHPRFLNIYSRILKDGGEIYQKTDDENFFKFSLESYAAAGYEVSCCDDLAANPVPGDVATEHQLKFMAQGKKIYRIVARCKK